VSDLLEAAKRAADTVLGHGADEAKVSVSRSRGVDVEWRDGQLERIQEQTRRSLGVEVYVDGRYSASSTNDLRPDALDAFLGEAVQMTRLLEPDPHRGLPDPERYEGRADIDLDLCDPAHGDLDSEARRAFASELESMVRERAGELPIVSVATGFGDRHAHSARIHTNGFVGEREGTSFSYSAMVTVKDEGSRRPMGWDYCARRYRSDLVDPADVAQRAVEHAASQLGAGKLPTGRYTVVLDRRAVPRLLGAFLGPLSGPSLQQRRSLWEGKLGCKVASELLTLIDEPHRPRGLGSALWDGDGIATRRRPLVEAGVLSTFLIDQYYARKMDTEPTGASTHGFEWALGDRDLDGLLADVGSGVYIDRFLGGNSNQTTGETSLGCGGRVIRDGKLAEPVQEVNLAGHIGELWSGLSAVGNDPDPNRSSACPSCVLDDVQLSGS